LSIKKKEIKEWLKYLSVNDRKIRDIWAFEPDTDFDILWKNSRQVFTIEKRANPLKTQQF
jgi:hypothetical protein